MIVVVPSDRGFVRRSMLYTAITRARVRLSIVAYVRDLDRALGAREFRCTYLKEHLRAAVRVHEQRVVP